MESVYNECASEFEKNMRKKVYKPRLSDEEMKRRLESTGALLIEGAKWCGKTTSAEQVAKKVVRFNDPDAQPQIQAMLEVSPRR